MCGILTIYKEAGISRQDIKDAQESLQIIKHRGPDGEGIVLINTKTNAFKIINTIDTPPEIKNTLPTVEMDNYNYDLLIAHRRLSIIDLSVAGHQPMKDKNNNWIVYNGEIYNYLELKIELEKYGYNFISDTDTEVLLYAYDKWGINCLRKLNGMWAFCIWDNQKKQLFISNDRFGVKPLYYSITDDSLILVSELKQCKPFKSIDKSINQTNVDIYLNNGFVGYDNSTFLSNISRFPAGSYSLISFPNIHSIKKEQYYYSIFDIEKRKFNFSEAIEEFRNLFYDAVKIRTRSDVPWGVGLSGGLDSSAVLLFASQYIKETGANFKPSTFSAVFPGEIGDESEHIENMNRSIELNSYFTNPLTNFSIEEFEKHLYYLELPPASTSFFAQWEVAKLVKKSGITVNLVGQGADEVFGGYHAHFYRYCRELIWKGNILKYLNLVYNYSELKGISVKKIHHSCINELKTSIKFKIGLKKMDNSLTSKWQQIDKLTSFMKEEFHTFQLPYYLLADDRTSMAHSVETRHPFLDYRIVEFGYSLPEKFYINKGWQKFIIRTAMKELPEEIRWRKDKKGFTTPFSKILNESILPKYSLNIDNSVCNNERMKFRQVCYAIFLKQFN